MLIQVLNKILNEHPHSVPDNKITYLPAFSSQEDFTNHYHRACWYMPYQQDAIEQVIMHCSSVFSLNECPDYMCSGDWNNDHIRQQLDAEEYAKDIVTSKFVLIWDEVPLETINLLKQRGIQVFDVTTNKIETTEYGFYCKLFWHSMAEPIRKALVAESHEKFKNFTQKIKSKNYKAAAVFGTGPSVDNASDYDFSECYTHACNTIVQSQELLDIVQPDIISAGDVVSHFGVSLFAHKFRDELATVMRERGTYFLCTAQFGYLFMAKYPDLAGQVLLCEQKGRSPNYNLLYDWSLPILDSVLNIHMLPCASTLFNTVFILGCDGQNPDVSKNEDFWQHSKKAQYHNLVDSGHLAHPTFAVHRKSGTWDGYQNSVLQTCGIGENLHGKRYISLAQSFTPGLTERYMPHEGIRQNFPWLLKE